MQTEEFKACCMKILCPQIGVVAYSCGSCRLANWRLHLTSHIVAFRLSLVMRLMWLCRYSFSKILGFLAYAPSRLSTPVWQACSQWALMDVADMLLLSLCCAATFAFERLVAGHRNPAGFQASGVFIRV